jgi:hypothetical protein
MLTLKAWNPWAVYLGVGVVTAALTAIAIGFPIAAAVLLGLPIALLIITRPHWVVVFLTAYIPFESFLLKLLPASDWIYLVSQFISEILIYLVLAAFVLHKMAKRSYFRRTPIDLPILTFMGVALLSILVNGVPLFDGLVNIRAFLRYVIFFYLVVNLGLTRRQASLLVWTILAVGVVQLLIGGLQLTIGEPLTSILLPKQVTTTIAGHTREFRVVTYGRELGSIFGTLGDTVFFGTFMIIVLALYLARTDNLTIRNSSIIVIILFAIGFSYSRAAVFAALLMVWVFYRIRFGVTRTLIISLLVLTVGSVGALLLADVFPEYVNPEATQQNILENVTGVFSQRYVAIAQGQRLGFLINTIPAVLLSRPVLGYGPDQETAVEQLNASDVPLVLQKWRWREKGFKDVYWVTILAYYGLAGLVLLTIIFFRLYSAAWHVYKTSTDKLTRQLASAMICLVGVTTFLLFFNETLEFRAYGFYFWLLAALMFGLYSRERKSAILGQA